MSTQNIYDMADTWNSAGTTFNAIKMNVTDTASAAGSLLMDLQVGGTSRFNVDKTGTVNSGDINVGTSNQISLRASDSSIRFLSDVFLTRDTSDTLAQRRSTNAQAFRIYNTYTDASNYERAVAAWSGNIFYFGTQAAGTGTGSRQIIFFTDSINRWNIGGSSGHFLASTDNTYDIGASGANRPRNLYVAGRANIDGLTVGKGGQTAVASNTALGFEALNSASLTGTNNVGIGYAALYSNTTGGDNSAMGYAALYLNTTGGNNSAMGVSALVYNTTGSYNSAVGRSALYSNTTGANNSAVGVYALYSNTTGSSNSAMGYAALYSNTTGDGNSAMGVQALYENTTGSNSSALGFDALRRFVSAGNQVAIGYRALRGGDATPANNTGANNIAIGYQAGDAITTGSTNLVIGYDIDVDSATGSNQVNIADRYFHDRIRLLERTSDPAKPAEGNMIVWMSDGTGLGDDGDVIIASTAGGVTNYAILFDHSAGTLWP